MLGNLRHLRRSGYFGFTGHVLIILNGKGLESLNLVGCESVETGRLDGIIKHNSQLGYLSGCDRCCHLMDTFERIARWPELTDLGCDDRSDAGMLIQCNNIKRIDLTVGDADRTELLLGTLADGPSGGEMFCSDVQLRFSAKHGNT